MALAGYTTNANGVPQLADADHRLGNEEQKGGQSPTDLATSLPRREREKRDTPMGVDKGRDLLVIIADGVSRT